MDESGAVRNEREEQTQVEIRCRKQEPLLLRCLRSLKGETTFGSSMNLAVSRKPMCANSN